jgi:hypothetical protein
MVSAVLMMVSCGGVELQMGTFNGGHLIAHLISFIALALLLAQFHTLRMPAEARCAALLLHAIGQSQEGA